MYQRILDALKGSDSRNPLTTSAVAKALGVTREELDPVVDALYEHRAICRCDVIKQGEASTQIWLTGIAAIPSRDAFTINPKKRPPSGSFIRPNAPRAKGIEEQKEQTMKTKTAFDIVQEMLEAKPTGVSRADLIMAAKSTSGVDNAIYRLCNDKKAHRTGRGSIAWGPEPAAGNEIASSAIKADPVTPPAVKQEAPTIELRQEAPLRLDVVEDDQGEAPPEVDFAIHADGRLSIIDGGAIMVLPPTATRRLGYFLGCLEINSWPPRLDPTVSIHGEAK